MRSVIRYSEFMPVAHPGGGRSATHRKTVCRTTHHPPANPERLPELFLRPSPRFWLSTINLDGWDRFGDEFAIRDSGLECWWICSPPACRKCARKVWDVPASASEFGELSRFVCIFEDVIKCCFAVWWNCSGIFTGSVEYFMEAIYWKRDEKLFKYI